MKILLINHYAGSSQLGMEYRPFYLAREWVRAGHDVTILAATFSHLRIRQPSPGPDLREEIVDGVRYVWLTTPRYSGNGLRRGVNIAVFMAKLFRYRRRIQAAYAPDVVIASSTYPTDNWPARRLAAAAGAELVYEVHDVWPLSLIELGGMSPRHPFSVAMQWGENYACRHADKVVSMLPCTKEHFEAHGMAADKWAYVPNGIDPDEWSSAPAALPAYHAAALAQLKVGGRFVVGYAGSHGIANDLSWFVRAASALDSSGVTLVLVGQGPEKANLERLASEEGISNVVFLPPVPKEAVPSLLQSFDVGFVGWRRQPIARLGVSHNKTFDYMMAGRPILYAVDAGNDVATESGGGITIEPESVQAIVDGVDRFMAMTPEDRDAMGQRGRDFVLANHTYPVLARRFLEAIGQGGLGTVA
jgi:glycosyltransferase involved in cell wall biosynthesis